MYVWSFLQIGPQVCFFMRSMCGQYMWAARPAGAPLLGGRGACVAALTRCNPSCPLSWSKWSFYCLDISKWIFFKVHEKGPQSSCINQCAKAFNTAYDKFEAFDNETTSSCHCYLLKRITTHAATVFGSSEVHAPLYHQCLTLFLLCTNIYHHQGVYNHKFMTIDG